MDFNVFASEGLWMLGKRKLFEAGAAIVGMVMKCPEGAVIHSFNTHCVLGVWQIQRDCPGQDRPGSCRHGVDVLVGEVVSK